MKKLLSVSLFLILGLGQILVAQTKLSQFSAPTAKQRAALQDAASANAQARSAAMPGRPVLGEKFSSTPTAAAKTRSARSRPHGSNPPLNPVGFVNATQIPAGGSSQWSAVAADFNGDGKLDIAAPVESSFNPVTSVATFAVSIVLSNGDGTFQAAKLTPNPNGVEGDQILVGDFDGDGKQDLIVVHATSPSTFEVWLGNGDGTFKVGSNFLNPISPNFLVGGVVTPPDASGNLDLLFADALNPANVWTVLGNGDGTFSQTPTSVAVSGGPLSNVVFADFNGDGVLDFAATQKSTVGLNTIYQDAIFLGQANGTYLPGTLLTNPDLAYDICNNSVGDLNGDGKLEIVSANNCNSGGAAGTLTVYINNGNGTFQSGVYYASGTESTANTDANIAPLAVTIADVNGDGMNDIVSSNAKGGDVTILLGNGDGTVNVPTVGYSTGGSPKTSALVADFNGDGLADIIVPDNEFSFAYLQGYGDGAFRSALDYYSPVPGGYGAGGTTMATGDFNGDGYPDLVIGNVGYNNPNGSKIGITVLLSKPDGSLQPGVNYGTGGSYQGVAVADFDGDSKLDIASVNESNNGIQIFRGGAAGTFALGLFYSTGGTNAFALVAGDFNHDGHPDLAVANYGSNNVSVLLNDGTGAFPTSVTYPTGGKNQSIVAADVNNDGILDLVVTQQNPGVVAVLLGNADGTFQAATTPAFGFNDLGNLALGDLDGDGKLDLAVTVDDPSVGTGLAVAKGNGDGTFQPAVLYSTTLQNLNLSQPLPGAVQMVDLNGDGKLDLVYSNLNYGTIGVLYNTGTNAFGSAMFYDPVEYATGSNVFALALVDINGDGAVDVVAADNDYAGATVMLNARGSANTVVSSANPATLGQSITFTATITTKVRGVTAVPTGTVTFLDGSTSLGSGTLNNGAATLTTSSLAVGTHSVTAQYGGDSNFHSSTSTGLSEVITATPDFAFSANPSSVTANAGTSAQYTFTVTPSNGYTGTVTFSCGTLPAKTSCSFSPASLSPSNNAYGTATLTLSTTAATASLIVPAPPNSKTSAPSLWASLGGFGAFGVVLAGLGRRRNRRQMAIVLGTALLVTMFSLLGCGGSNSTPITTGTPGTPAGSYTIAVTATGTGSSSPTHSMNLTLVVQ
jgi:hypothetical protein